MLQLCFPHMTGYIFRQFAASARYSPRQAPPVARCRNSGKYIICARPMGLSQEMRMTMRHDGIRQRSGVRTVGAHRFIHDARDLEENRISDYSHRYLDSA